MIRIVTKLGFRFGKSQPKEKSSLHLAGLVYFLEPNPFQCNIDGDEDPEQTEKTPLKISSKE